ncbi:MAG TPA: hypothetical protein PLK88_02715 [Methanothrix sp.]|nr:hypothetical protein [Methanothrix sp.]
MLLRRIAKGKSPNPVEAALRQTSREATVLLYSPALDPHLQEMAELADRVFCIYSRPAGAKGRGKAEARMTGKQSTLEAYS